MNSQEAKTPAQHFGKLNSVYWQEWNYFSKNFRRKHEKSNILKRSECPQSAEVELITHGQLLSCNFNSKCLIKIQQKAATQVSKDRHLALNSQSPARQQKETLGQKRFHMWTQYE